MTDRAAALVVGARALALHPDHVADLRKSGLSDATIQALGFRSLSPAELVRAVGPELAARTQTAMEIPYPGTTFRRIKFFPAVVIPADDPADKPTRIRYYQPPETAPALYLPPRAQAALLDPGLPLFVTEGEKKAAKADELGLACFAIGGVWNWLSAGHPLDALDTIDWVRRNVGIIPDADVWGRVDLLRATFALGRELELRGASITVIKLPSPLKLDDYLVAHPVDEFACLPLLTLKEAPLSSMATWWKDWHRRRTRPSLPDTGPYVVHQGRLCHRRETKDGPVLDALANFTATIREEFILDDGVETTRAFLLEGRLETGPPLPLVRVPAARFAGMTWVTDAWGMRAVVRAGFSTRDALREAIQVLSPAARSRHIYTHTGWRELEGRWAYLHATGAIGATNCEVDLGPELARYSLPAPLEDPVSSLTASLDLLRAEIAPASVMVPLWAAVFRAPTVSILPADVSLWLEGTTGSLKSTLAALALAHYGPFDRLTLPGAWASTANALERRAFLLKDVLFVIDDFAPGALDAKEYELKAARILRAAGNRAGRGRLRADLSERPAYPPRGLILATGESRPSGQSLLARTLVLEVDRGEINLDALGRAQAQAARLPHALAAYITWLAPQMPTLRDTLAEAFARTRQQAMADDPHLRLPEAVSHLYLGFDLGMACAQELGACSEADGDQLRAMAWSTLTALSTAQGALIVSEKPTHRFLRVVATLVAQGRAVLLDREPGDGPVPFRADLLGWQDTEALYLLPEAAWHAVTRFCRESGEPFPSRESRLRHDLKQEGIAEVESGRRTATVQVAGKTRRVIRIARLVAEELLDEPFPTAPKPFQSMPITSITGITGPDR